jgi:hypothetical protein
MIVRSGRSGRRAWWRRAAATLVGTCEPHDDGYEVAQAGHDAGPLADLGAVFVEVHVADILQG